MGCILTVILSLDVAFLISNHFKKERRGGSGLTKGPQETDVLYSELGGGKNPGIKA